MSPLTNTTTSGALPAPTRPFPRREPYTPQPFRTDLIQSVGTFRTILLAKIDRYTALKLMYDDVIATASGGEKIGWIVRREESLGGLVKEMLRAWGFMYMFQKLLIAELKALKEEKGAGQAAAGGEGVVGVNVEGNGEGKGQKRTAGVEEGEGRAPKRVKLTLKGPRAVKLRLSMPRTAEERLLGLFERAAAFATETVEEAEVNF